MHSTLQIAAEQYLSIFRRVSFRQKGKSNFSMVMLLTFPVDTGTKSRMKELVAVCALSLVACGEDDSVSAPHARTLAAQAIHAEDVSLAADGMQSVPGCTRASLKAAVASYFEALAAHDPAKLSSAADVKFTENAKALKLGEGSLWKTAGAVTFTRSLYDTERCGTVTEAVLPNGGQDTIVGVRLKVVNQLLTEIETIVVDPKTGFVPTPKGILSSNTESWEKILPEDQRSTRDELEAAGKSYFDWFSNPQVKPPFALPCDRLENGFQTTRGRCDNLGQAAGLKHPAQRYPFSDVETGLTAGFVLFAGSSIDFHMFKVVSGKIEGIHAVVGPAVRSSGW